MGGKHAILLCVFMFFAFTAGCPSAESIAPHCNCRQYSSYSMMFCNGILSPDQLVGPMKEVEISKVKILSLSIDNSSLQYIPDGIFKDTFIEKIRFLSTEILSLSDSDVAFRGLENILTEIRATDAHFIAQWDWNQLRNMNVLELIDINWLSLGTIDEPFPALHKLTHLGIIRAEITHIVDNAFSSLSKLTILNMKENYISELKRNMFPNPADKLFILDFSDNQLSYLPEDFFTNMPSLTDLHLDKNKFTTLAEEPFTYALENLQGLTMSDNEFRCDCRMRWLAGIRTPYYFKATCSSPETLSGVPIRSLDIKALWC